MDVVEIGSETLVSGGVYAVKPLAILAMIDDGELDWKASSAARRMHALSTVMVHACNPCPSILPQPAARPCHVKWGLKNNSALERKA